MFPFDSVFYHLVLFAFNCLIFKELCRPLSHRLCLATAFIYYHVFNFLSTLFSNYFHFCFSVVTVLLTTLLSYHLLTLFVNIFFSLLSTFFFLSFFLILFILYILYILVSGWRLVLIWLLSGWHPALVWLQPGSHLVLAFLFYPLHRCTAAFYFGSGYFGTYYLYKKIPLFYKQNLFIAVIYLLEP